MKQILKIATSEGQTRSIAVTLACGGLATLGWLVALPVVKGKDQAAAGRSKKPNVVVVMTDDTSLAQMKALRATRRTVGRQGVIFSRSYAAQPKCCPNRASFLTGQYPHNHGVRNNEPPAGGYDRLNHSKTLPVWLNRAGYRTSFIGKYMNGYRASKGIPPGWDEWAALTNRFAYYDFTLNVNGQRVQYGSRPSDYQTDVLADRAADFIDRSAVRRQPFFLWVAPVAPHVIGGRADIGDPDNPTPAPRYEGRYSGAKAPRTPNFNEKDVSDKPRFIRKLSRLSESQKHRIDNHYRSTLAALLSVNDLVAKIRSRLQAHGALDKTLFVFTTDNGMFFGEHRNFCCKDQIYEEAARLPLMMRGPGIPHGVVRRQLVSTIDIAPTILDLTGSRANLPTDGRSLLPIAARGSAGTGRDLLIETSDHRFFAVRAGKWKYAANSATGERELYNLARDPDELRSLDGRPRYASVERRLRKRLAHLTRCEGTTC